MPISSVIKATSTAEVFSKILFFYCPPPQKILDITAGHRRMWEKIPYKGKQETIDGNPYSVTFIDIREEVKPDIVLNYLHIKNHIAENSYDVVILDPPWNISEFAFSYKDKEHQKEKVTELYGDRQFQLYELPYLDEQISYVLKPAGTLIIKIADKADCYWHVEFINKLKSFELFDIVIFAHESVRSAFEKEDDKRASKKHGYFLIFKNKKLGK
jgi:hypothetical protein